MSVWRGKVAMRCNRTSAYSIILYSFMSNTHRNLCYFFSFSLLLFLFYCHCICAIRVFTSRRCINFKSTKNNDNGNKFCIGFYLNCSGLHWNWFTITLIILSDYHFLSVYTRTHSIEVRWVYVFGNACLCGFARCTNQPNQPRINDIWWHISFRQTDNNVL